MAVSAKTRKKTKTVVVGGKPKFPMPDKSHARLALRFVGSAKGMSPGQKRKVVSRAYKMLGTPTAKRRVKVTSAGRITRRK